MRILVLAGKNGDEKAVASLVGDCDFELAHYVSVSRGVRQLEKKAVDLTLVVPDRGDATWERAVRRILHEFDLPSIVVAHRGANIREQALKAGAYGYLELGASTRDEFNCAIDRLTLQRGLESRLSRQAVRLDWIEETGRLGSWEMDSAGRTVWSKGLRRIVESGGKRLGNNFISIRQFVHPEDLEMFDQANKATFEEGWPLDFEYRLMDAEGKVRHLHLNRRVELGPGGEVVRAYGMAQDVTPQKEFEHFLFRRDAILQVVGEFAGHFLRESDWESSIDSALESLGKAADATRSFVLEKGVSGTGELTMSLKHEWASPETEPIMGLPTTRGRAFGAVYNRWKEALTKGKVIAGHVRSFQQNERELFGIAGIKSIMLVPVHVGSEWWGFMGLSEHREEREWAPVEVESMTLVADMFGSAILRRNMEDLLVEANRSAQEAKTMALEASQAKSRFLANMSHEIRTPLSGILGMTEMTITTGLTEEQREHMNMIRDAADSLLGIVNDVLDISKIEADKMELRPEEFSLREEIDRLVRPFAVQAEQKGVVFQHRFMGGVPEYVHGDPDKLGQILRNLVGNALKFTQRGLIELTVEVAEENADRVSFLFTVRDTGEGIATDKLATVFDSFTQADSSTHKKHQGTGLGLAICRELVQMMGGTIGVESEPGRGSFFSFTAWFDKVQVPAPSAQVQLADAPQTLHLTILLAEDNLLNQKYLTHFLTLFGHTVIVANNGLEALGMLKKQGRDIDVVLMDVQMPEKGGIDTTLAIRSSDGREYDPDIPIIALTAYAMKGDRERMIAAGMDDYVSKPIDMKKLAAAIARCMDGSGRNKEAVEAAQTVAAEPDQSPVHVDLDMDGLVKRFEDDGELLKDILELFLLEAKEKLAQLDASVKSGGSDDLGTVLHSITNLASHVLAMDIVDRARALEKLCYLGRKTEALAGVRALRPLFVGLVAAVRERVDVL